MSEGELDVFHFDDERQSFEGFGQTNGSRFWFARDLMKMLGYETFSSFENAINKAVQACTTLKISVLDNIAQVEREVDGKSCRDYKLSRFGCYLVAINGDVKKPQVAMAQAYFASMAEAIQAYLQKVENVERLLIRDEISEREVSLSGVAKSAGVVVYAFFQNAGYRGMYNMDLRRLKDFKGIDQGKCLLDYMGREELAANLFRITQTEAKIKNDRVRGQTALETTAFNVGRKVRATMEEISGTRPESLPLAEDINTVKKGLKQAQRELAKLDKPGKG
ncbi:MAG TPA: BRO family protein [Bryobacteraceae bacterium]|nr:BRO family protein [Bryobacteraceae bacterium]